MSNSPDPDQSLSDLLQRQQRHDRKRRSRVIVVGLVLLAIIVAFIVPGSRFYILGIFGGESHFEGKPTVYWEKELAHNREMASEQLLSGGPDAVPVLVQIIERDNNAHSAALEVLLSIAPEGKEAIPALIDELRADDLVANSPHRPREAATVLARFGADAKGATEHLLKKLDDPARHSPQYHDALLAIEPALCKGRLLRYKAGRNLQWVTPLWVSIDGYSLVGVNDEGKLVRLFASHSLALGDVNLGIQRFIACTPDGATIVFRDESLAKLCVLDTATGEQISLADAPSGLSYLDISLDGKLVRYGEERIDDNSLFRTSHVLDAETGQEVATEIDQWAKSDQDTLTVPCLGDQVIAEISGERADHVTLSRKATGEKLADLNWHEEPPGYVGQKIRALAVSADGKTLVSCDEDGWIKYWNLPGLLSSIAGADADQAAESAKVDQGAEDNSPVDPASVWSVP